MYSFCIASGFKLSLITPLLSILYTSTKLQRGRVTVIRLSVKFYGACCTRWFMHVLMLGSSVTWFYFVLSCFVKSSSFRLIYYIYAHASYLMQASKTRTCLVLVTTLLVPCRVVRVASWRSC